MANLKLVGAVAIKVRPDASGFKEEADRQLKKETANLKAEVPVEPKLDEGEIKAKAKKLEKDLSGKSFTWNVKLDHDSVRAAQKQFDSMMEPTQEIKFTLGDEKSIKEAAAKLEELAKKAKVKITYSEDAKGYQSVLDKIAALRRQKLEQTIHVGMDDAELDKLEKKMRSKLAKAAGEELQVKGTSTIKLEYDENRASLEELLKKIDAELAKFKDQTIYVDADEDSLREARAAVVDALTELPVRFEYDNNRTSLAKAIKEIDAELDKVRTKLFIESLLDEPSLVAARAKLQAELADIQETIEISYRNERSSLEKALKEIDEAIARIDEVTIEVGTNPFELAWVRADIEAALSRIPVTLTYNKNKAGLEKAIAEIDALLAKDHEIKIETSLDPLKLMMTKAKLQEELGKQTVEIEYEEDLAGLKSLRAKIMALLPVSAKLHISTELNEAALLAELAKADAMIEAAEAAAKIKPKVQPEISASHYATTWAALKALAKSQTVGIFVKLNNASVLLAAAKLTGLRAASRWTEAFAKSLGKLDRNLPIVAALVVGINTLTSGILSLTASAFSLGNGLGQVLRMAALLAPAMILGFAAVATVMKGVFKDFGAAVNGDQKAIDKLTESGKKAAANMRVIFQDIRETVSKNFWAEASDNMLRFTETALPAVRDGMAKLSTSLGGVFGSIVDATSKFAQEDGFLVFFSNLTRGFDNVRDGMAPFMSAFLGLAALGSTIFPRMGAAFEVMSHKFDSWVTGLAMDGTFNRWIDQGVQGLKDLWSAGVSLVGVWKNIGAAAQGAGALTLTSFAQMWARVEDTTAGYRFQTNLGRIFQGARDASDTFHEALGRLGPAMDVFSVTMGNALANSGKALASFIALLGDIMSSSNLDKGMTAFLSGVQVMFDELRPAMGPVTEILRTFGEILGSIARDSGPLFRTLFTQLASVFTTAWHALEPFLPALIQVGTTIVGVLGPAMASIANDIIPAFAGGLADLGDGLVPVIQLLAFFATAAADMLKDVPLPVIAGMVGGILALTGAMTAANVVLPLVGGALQAFGVTAALTGARLQLMIPVVGIFLAAITGLAIGGIATLATSMSSGTPFANEYETALREDADAAKELGDAIGDATTKLTIKKLADSGAYDAAKKLGIGTAEVTEAVLNGGKALEDIQAKIAAAERGYGNLGNVAATTGDETAALTGHMVDQKGASDILKNSINENRGSREKATEAIRIQTEAEKLAGIQTGKHAEQVDLLGELLKKQTVNIGAAAAATDVLTDAFSSSSAKVDAMRKTFDILLGKNAKQEVAETLGAYARGFNDLKETVTPLAGKMKELGDSVYGEDGFLNVAGGNKAVMQVNQALVDEVNNVWVGAKAAYDAAIKAGDNSYVAFAKSQEFVKTHKGDYDALAEASGVSAEKVQGQWDAVFGHEWVLRVALQGATEAAARAQALVQAVKGNFDGQRFMAWLDANPDMAMKATYDAEGVAQAFVDHEWKTKLDALPKPAQDALRALTGQTEAEWTNGHFEATLNAANKVPGLAEAIMAIRNGADASYIATLLARVDSASVSHVQYLLDKAANPRIVQFKITYDDSARDAAMAGRGARNGAIMDSSGRGMYGFNPEYVKHFANGGIENHVAQIQRAGGPVRIWAEPETKAEAYIPYAQAKRPRSLAILGQVAKDFGYTLTKATDNFANGGLAGHATGPSTTNNASVTIGTLVTTDADAAVRKIRTSQQDALAVAGITLNGA